MSRPLLILAVILLVLIGGLFVLAGRDSARTPVRMEKAVALENLA